MGLWVFLKFFEIRVYCLDNQLQIRWKGLIAIEFE